MDKPEPLLWNSRPGEYSSKYKKQTLGICIGYLAYSTLEIIFYIPWSLLMLGKYYLFGIFVPIALNAVCTPLPIIGIKLSLAESPSMAYKYRSICTTIFFSTMAGILFVTTLLFVILPNNVLQLDSRNWETCWFVLLGVGINISFYVGVGVVIVCFCRYLQITLGNAPQSIEL